MQTFATTQKHEIDAASELKLRLTRRGKIVLAASSALLVITPVFGSVFNTAASAEATDTVASADYGYIIPMAGDSLWSIAERLDPQADPRILVAELARFNQLESLELNLFEPLAVPAAYADHKEVLTAAEVGL